MARVNTENSTVYSLAEAYDLAFSYRNITHEVDFLLSIYEDTICPEFPKGRLALIELASGPARHAMDFARRGWRAVGMDLSPEMCRYGKLVCEKAGVSVSYICDDIINFRAFGEFNLAIMMLDSVCHIRRKRDLERHLKSVAQSLTPQGVYIVEASFDQDQRKTTKSEWTVESDNSILDVVWKDLRRVGYDCYITEFKLFGRVMGSKIDIFDTFVRRAWRREDIENAIKNSQVFDIHKIYHDFSKDGSGAGHPWRNIFVLRKKSF